MSLRVLVACKRVIDYAVKVFNCFMARQCFFVFSFSVSPGPPVGLCIGD